MTSEKDDLELINKLLEIYDQKYLGEFLNKVSPGQWCRETINRWVKGKASPRLSHREFEALQELFPKPPLSHPNYDFDFVDLFAGIGAFRPQASRSLWPLLEQAMGDTITSGGSEDGPWSFALKRNSK